MYENRFKSVSEHSIQDRLDNSFNDFVLSATPKQEEDIFSEAKFKFLAIGPGNETNIGISTPELESTSHSQIEQFQKDFINFLTFRSYGNPKMLNSLLNSFIVNYEVLPLESPEYSEFLHFDYHAIYRIQAISSIYQVIAQRFEPKLLFGDDKPVLTLFYIVNFLLKFHRRAFSWTSIEHVDELVHVHKSLETRPLIQAVIAEWSDRYLDHIRNGIFDFRFGQDFAAELRFLSKMHLDEMAAMNFTLDESRHLKALYRQLIDAGKDHPNFEYFAVLAELHEFDGDFLYARNYFQKALLHLDRTFLTNPLFEKLHLNFDAELFFKDENEGGPVKGLIYFLSTALTSPQMLETAITWATTRLRFMIRIAMTYELANHFESARFGYRSAAQFAKALLKTWMENTDDSLLHLAKTLNIIFLPTFAEAWTMEKAASTLDAGVSLVEQELETIERTFLKTVRQKTHRGPKGRKVHVHINFYVILAELFHKFGDMYFAKGKNIIKSKDFSPKDMVPQTQGFLGGAARQYVHGLGYLLIYFNLRLRESGMKYSFHPNEGIDPETPIPPTFSEPNQPTYFLRVFLGILRDLSFTLMAKTSTRALVQETGTQFKGAGGTLDYRDVDQYMAGLYEQTRAFMTEPLPKSAAPFSRNPDHFTLFTKHDRLEAIICHEEKSHRENLIISLSLQIVASQQLRRGGYPGKAIRSFLQTAETTQHYLEWMLIYCYAAKHHPDAFSDKAEMVFAFNNTDNFVHFLSSLYVIGLYCLREATSIAQIRNKSVRDVHKKHLLHGLLNVSQLYEANNIKLNVDNDALLNWLEKPPGLSCENLMNNLKTDCLEFLFPFGSRLRGLKTLNDHYVMFDMAKPEDSSLGSLNLDLNELNREILFLDSQYDNNSIFSPFYRGITFALTYLYFAKKDKDKAKFWRRHALKYLDRSYQMITQGPAYYEFVSDKYFLYEDFNDREFQFGHAIQMAGSGIIALFQHILTRAKGDPKGKRTTTETKRTTSTNTTPRSIREIAKKRVGLSVRLIARLKSLQAKMAAARHKTSQARKPRTKRPPRRMRKKN